MGNILAVGIKPWLGGWKKRKRRKEKSHSWIVIVTPWGPGIIFFWAKTAPQRQLRQYSEHTGADNEKSPLTQTVIYCVQDGGRSPPSLHERLFEIGLTHSSNKGGRRSVSPSPGSGLALEFALTNRIGQKWCSLTSKQSSQRSNSSHSRPLGAWGHPIKEPEVACWRMNDHLDWDAQQPPVPETRHSSSGPKDHVIRAVAKLPGNKYKCQFIIIPTKTQKVLYNCQLQNTPEHPSDLITKSWLGEGRIHHLCDLMIYSWKLLMIISYEALKGTHTKTKENRNQVLGFHILREFKNRRRHCPRSELEAQVPNGSRLGRPAVPNPGCLSE